MIEAAIPINSNIGDTEYTPYPVGGKNIHHEVL